MAADGPADYVAIGPVYATVSKLVPDPVVGLEGVRAARAMTTKPLVAIGGINRSNCAAVIGAGADSVAVISDLIPDPGPRVEEFLLAWECDSQQRSMGSVLRREGVSLRGSVCIKMLLNKLNKLNKPPWACWKICALRVPSTRSWRRG